MSRPPSSANGATKIATPWSVLIRRPDGEAGRYNLQRGDYEKVSHAEFNEAPDKHPHVPVFCDRCFGSTAYQVDTGKFRTFVVGTCCIFSPEHMDSGAVPVEMRKYQQPIGAHQTMVQMAPGVFKYSHNIQIGTVLGYWHVHKDERVYLNMIGGVDESSTPGRRCVDTFTDSELPCALSLGTLNTGMNEVILECSLVLIPARKGCHAKIYTGETVHAGLERFCFQPHSSLSQRLLASFGMSTGEGSDCVEDEEFYKAHIDALNNYIKLLRVIYTHKGETDIEKYLIEGSKLYSELVGESSKVLSANMQAYPQQQVSTERAGTSHAPQGGSSRGSSVECQGQSAMGGYPPPHPGMPGMGYGHHFAPQMCGDSGLATHYQPPYPGYYNQGYSNYQMPPGLPGHMAMGPMQPPNPYALPHHMYGSQPYAGHPQPPASRAELLKAELMETLGLAPKPNVVQEGLRGLISGILDSELKGYGIKRGARAIVDHESGEEDVAPVRAKRAREEAAPRTPVKTTATTPPPSAEAIVGAPYGEFDAGLTSKIGQVGETVEKLSRVLETLVSTTSRLDPVPQPTAIPAQPTTPAQPLPPQQPIGHVTMVQSTQGTGGEPLPPGVGAAAVPLPVALPPPPPTPISATPLSTSTPRTLEASIPHTISGNASKPPLGSDPSFAIMAGL
ncbi:putative capsid maturation protease [Silurid herpesvirus 1]|nr:putative capsid maturation protease [Silurid herpesvirus 1]